MEKYLDANTKTGLIYSFICGICVFILLWLGSMIVKWFNQIF
jgi:hypothetical protein